jgi:hypothetical protein
VPDDANGVLQDVHWSRGGFGYFPTYSLGNVMSLQIWERLREDVGDVDEQIGQGEFGAIREWLRDNLHRMAASTSRRDARARRSAPRSTPSRTSLSAGEARGRMIERVCVVGAGVIGSLFAGHLGRIAEVSVLCRREEHARALNDSGLRVSGRADFTVPVRLRPRPPSCPFPTW